MSENKKNRNSSRGIFVYIVVLSVIVLYVLVSMWPASVSTEANQTITHWPTNETVTVFARSFTLSGEVTILWIVMLMGALGALVYMSIALGTHVANNDWNSGWTLWYLVHPLMGSALALMFYLAIRGGFLNPSGSSTSINLYGVGAVSAMVGFSTRVASKKLQDLFGTLFGDSSKDGVHKTDGQLSVSLVSPGDSETVTSPVTLKVNVKVATPIEGATVTIYLDEKQLSAGLTDSTGSYSYQPTLTTTGGTHSWYAEASKTGFTSGKSPTWSFTY